MAQSALTVTTPNPTPPTNFGFTGATPPNAPNYTKLTYTNYVGVGLATAQGGPGAPPAPLGLWSAVTNPPPYYDDGAAGSPVVFAANVAALASGTGATSGGTENTYPGTGTFPFTAPNTVGAVPASTSVAHEGAGTETLFTQTYSGAILAPIPLTTVGCGPTQTAATILAGPNASHASSLSPTTAPALTSITPTTAVSGTGTTALTAVTGTGFNKQSVVYANGVAIPTVFVSATSLTATMPKKATSGTWPVTVVTGGAITTAPQTFTWT
jgi:hypothetical protein